MKSSESEKNMYSSGKDNSKTDIKYHLVIAEKPSVAIALGKVLGAHERHDGYIQGSGYIVSWCVGHLVEPAMPEDYDDTYKAWLLNTLPIMPEKWKYVVKRKTAAQFRVLKKLMLSKEVTSIICATDAGREGELIFRLVYEQAGCKKPFYRLWISSMEESAIREGFQNLKEGSAYDNLYQSALCRQQADWVVGINGTRLFTCLYRNKLLKVGRVQTPTLSMIVDREAEILKFKKTPFYTVHLVGDGILAVSHKFTDKKQAEEIALHCAGKMAIVEEVLSENKVVRPPKLYDLTGLQRDANRIFSFTAKQTLDYAQSLYEKKLCTYPRTDAVYLSDDMEETARKVVSTVYQCYPFFGEMRGDSGNIKAVLNSRKVTDHHAIILTQAVSEKGIQDLSDGESKVLSLIACRILVATGSDHIYKTVKAQVKCEETEFFITGKTVLEEGFKAYEKALFKHFQVSPDAEKKSGNKRQKGINGSGEDGGNVQKEEDDNEGESENMPLPHLYKNMLLPAVQTNVVEGTTKPPARFTESSLLKSMERAGVNETDDDAERKGLGTPATRADIIEKLVKDGFLKRQKKQLIPTDDGLKLITVLPEIVKSPKLTSDWENNLTRIAKGEYRPEQFMEQIKEMVKELITMYHEVKEEDKNMFGSENAVGKCPKCGGDILMGRFGAYCSEKCGMKLSKAYGKELTEEEVKSLLAGEKTLVKDLKSKAGKNYSAFLTPTGIEEYMYTPQDGNTRHGFQWKFDMEFPEREER